MTVRTGVPSFVMAVVIMVGGCATSVPGSPSPTAPQQDSGRADAGQQTPTKELPRYASPVREPKDARDVVACDLLTDAQLAQLGLLADTARQAESPTTQSCSWSSATDDTNPAGVEINKDTSIAALDGIYILRDVLVNFEEREISGHPALRGDYNDDGSCTIYTAISDYQGMSTAANAAGRPLPDPCELPVRMAEFILSNLPPLTEE